MWRAAFRVAFALLMVGVVFCLLRAWRLAAIYAELRMCVSKKMHLIIRGSLLCLVAILLPMPAAVLVLIARLRKLIGPRELVAGLLVALAGFVTGALMFALTELDFGLACLWVFVCLWLLVVSILR